MRRPDQDREFRFFRGSVQSLLQASDFILNGTQAWLGYAMAEAMAIQQAENIKLRMALLGFMPENILGEMERIVQAKPIQPPRATSGEIA